MSFRATLAATAHVLLIVLATILAGLASTFLTGCRTLPTTRRPCLSQTPPTLNRAVLSGVIATGCPLGMVCLTPEAAVAVGEYIGATRTWVLSSWANCGPLEARRGHFGEAP